MNNDFKFYLIPNVIHKYVKDWKETLGYEFTKAYYENRNKLIEICEEKDNRMTFDENFEGKRVLDIMKLLESQANLALQCNIALELAFKVKDSEKISGIINEYYYDVKKLMKVKNK